MGISEIGTKSFQSWDHHWPVIQTYYDHHVMIIMSDACTINALRA
jgi:hypothetical protein